MLLQYLREVHFHRQKRLPHTRCCKELVTVHCFLLFLWLMVEKLSHHCSGIPVEFDGVLEHLLVCITFRAISRCSASIMEFGIWHILRSLDSYMPIFLILAARQSCPILSLKFVTVSFLHFPLYSAQILWISLRFIVVASSSASCL